MKKKIRIKEITREDRRGTPKEKERQKKNEIATSKEEKDRRSNIKREIRGHKQERNTEENEISR